MDRKQLSDAVYDVLEKRISHNRARELVDCAFNEIIEGLARDGEVKLHRFGRFVVLDKGARVGRNPRTGESWPVAPRKAVSFRPSPEFREAVNRGADG